MAHLFGIPGEQRRRADGGERGQGSGVVVSPDGYVLTNLHVIGGFDQIVVKLSDGRRLQAQVVGEDRLTDLALLKIPTENLVAVEWGDSDALSEGALVWAVGSPFGFQHSVTSGIVSAKNRGGQAGTVYQDFLQTDAAVNPGNSGGPLVDSHGRVIGINTMIVGPSFQGISLAIPSNVARRIYDRLRSDGRVARGWLGISLEQITKQEAGVLGLESRGGVLVTSLIASGDDISPAASAGLRPQDVIVRWNGIDIETTSQFSQAVAQTPIGTEVSLVVVRNGQQVARNVRVGERPAPLN